MFRVYIDMFSIYKLRQFSLQVFDIFRLVLISGWSQKMSHSEKANSIIHNHLSRYESYSEHNENYDLNRPS